MRASMGRAAVGLILTVGTLGFLPAQAEIACSVAAASETTPMIVDALNDYQGVVSGDESGIHVLADVYGEGVDLAKGWLARDEKGNYRAHIRVANLEGIETNVVYYMRWTFAGDDASKKKRWISAQTRPWGNAFEYGYLDETTPGVATLRSEGVTTGEVIIGEGGGFVIDVPLDKMGNPVSGDTLSELDLQARILIGHPGHGQQMTLPLPQVIVPLPSVELGQFGTIGGDTPVGGPTPVPGSRGGGLVSTVDDARNAPELCQTVSI